MGTRADYYIGRGEKAEWLGATGWDGHPDSTEDSQEGARMLNSKTDDQFRAGAKELLASRDDGTTPDQGWPWPWEDSNTTDFSYAIDDGVVYITCFGQGWKSYAEWQAHHAMCQEWRKKYSELQAKGMKEYDDIVKEIGDEPGGLWDDDEGESTCVFPNMKDVQNVTLGRRSGVIVLGG